MKNILYPLSILFFAILLFNSCEKEKPREELMYNAINYTTLGFVSFVSQSNTFLIEPDSTGEFYNNQYDISIMLIGLIRPYDVAIHFEIDTIVETEDTINAIEGFHYQLSADSFIIPAMSNIGKISISLFHENLSFEKFVILKMNLVSDDFEVIPYLASTNIILYNPYNQNDTTQIEPFISMFLGEFICNETGYGEYFVNFALDNIVENRIHNDNFWDWSAPGSTIYYDFSGDTTQTIIIPEQSITYGDSTVGSVSGTGTYDTISVTFSCDYNVWYGGVNYPTHNDFYRASKNCKSLISKNKADFFYP